MNELERLKLHHLELELGPGMSSARALDEAIYLEALTKRLGPWDPAYPHFLRAEARYEQLAYLLAAREAEETP